MRHMKSQRVMWFRDRIATPSTQAGAEDACDAYGTLYPDGESCWRTKALRTHTTVSVLRSRHDADTKRCLSLTSTRRIDKL